MMNVQKMILVRLILFIGVLSVLASCKEDEPDVDPIVRYKDALFQQHVTTEEVIYGENTTVLGSYGRLRMDVYEPQDDQLAARPVIIMAHGGYFTTGSKWDLRNLAIDLTKYGYVTATIDYRKWEGGIPVDSVELGEVAIQAMGDIKAAVRFFRQNAVTSNEYGVDDSQIILLGNSSGALASMLAGYLDNSEFNLLQTHLTTSINNNGGLEGDSGTPGIASDVKAVISIAGALFHRNIISPNEPKLLSIHGDADEVMPYCSGPFHDQLGNPGFGLIGPCNYHQRAVDWGIANELITIENGDHSSPFNSNNSNEVKEEIVNFLYYKVVNK